MAKQYKTTRNHEEEGRFEEEDKERLRQAHERSREREEHHTITRDAYRGRYGEDEGNDYGYRGRSERYDRSDAAQRNLKHRTHE